LKKKEEPKKNSADKVDVRTSSKNLFLNTAIILLGIIIIYMLYSIINKSLLKESENDYMVSQKPAADIIQMEVLNGCGVDGVAQKFTDYLRKDNFDVVNVSNYILNNIMVNDISHTLVIDRLGNKANAVKVAEALGIKKENIIEQINNNYFLDVTLIIGRDFNQLKPFK
jgi:hypothetical protein